jgi:hypothetical protein
MQTGWDAAATVRAQKRVEIPAGMTRERERTIVDAARKKHAAKALTRPQRGVSAGSYLENASPNARANAAG